MKVLLKRPALAPECYGQPIRCSECEDCGLRVFCHEKGAAAQTMFLLPVDKPAPAHRARWGSSFTRAFDPATMSKRTDQ